MGVGMTLRITIGVDPGVTGAIVVLADGEPVQFLDMPCNDRPGGYGQDVNPFRLTAMLREVRQRHPGADVFAVLEHVAMRPGNSRGSDQRSGENIGVVKGVLGALDIHWSQVQPQRWKKWFSLIGTDKDIARQYAINRFPKLAMALSRKKDIGRADALLIALWGWDNEAYADQPLLVAQKGRRKA